MGLKEKLKSLDHNQAQIVMELLGIDSIDSIGKPENTKFVLWPCNVCAIQKPNCDIDKQHFPCFVESPITEDQCPNCGSPNLWHGDKTWHGDQLEQETTCCACQFAFQQWYQITFDGMTKLDEDGCSHIDIK